MCFFSGVKWNKRSQLLRTACNKLGGIAMLEGVCLRGIDIVGMSAQIQFSLYESINLSLNYVEQRTQ
jgi:hypothetical protein